MMVSVRRGYVLIESAWVVRMAGRLTTGNWNAKGLALFPFIFVLDHRNTPAWLITHERIHFRQQIESLFIGQWLLSLIERVYARFVLKKSKMERYLYTASEQEAYLNMHNDDYLHKRPFGAVWKHVRTKRRFTLTGPGEITFQDEYEKGGV